MTTHVRGLAYILSLASLWAVNAGATSVPSLSFEELTDRSEVIAAGQISRSWTDWDVEHKYIWTHYELTVSSAAKGTPGTSIVLSEPGGVIGIQSMTIAGTVIYAPGERVLVFLQRMPNGYLRTTGWSQGKLHVDDTGRLHTETLLGGIELVNAPRGAASLRTLDGMTVTEFRSRIAARLKSQGRAQ